MVKIEKILSIGGIAGKTEGLVTYLRESIEGLFDYSQKDDLGSVSFVKKIGEGKKVMFSTALDTAGVIATYIDGSKIHVSNLGYFLAGSLAYSTVKFDKISGVLLPSGDFNKDTAITSFYVETGDEKAGEKVNLGDSGYFESTAKILPDGRIYDLGAGTKVCIYTLCKMAERLLSDEESLKQNGIGEVCFGFVSQEKLGNRGASVVSSAFEPDMIINLALLDSAEKNIGKVENGKMYIKMLDRSFVSSPEAADFAHKIIEKIGCQSEKRVSAKDIGEMGRLNLASRGAKCAEICIAVSNYGTNGECAQNIFD